MCAAAVLGTAALVALPSLASAASPAAPQFCNLGGTGTDLGNTVTVNLTICGGYYGQVFIDCVTSAGGTPQYYTELGNWTNVNATESISCLGLDPHNGYGYNLKLGSNGAIDQHYLN